MFQNRLLWLGVARLGCFILSCILTGGSLSVALYYSDVGAELLIVGVAHDHPDVDRASIEVEIVVGVDVGRKPVLAVDIFAVGLEVWKSLFLYLGHGLA